MSKGVNQKLKLSYLCEIMLERTDEDHGITMPQIMKALDDRGITAERKSIYSDFEYMTDFLGIEIMKEQIGRETYYHVASREFELAEVKLLVDAIQSSKFITQRKSNQLIKKIKKFVSQYQAGDLQRQLHVNGRIKTMNESVYYNVDNIYTAISQNKKIEFQYYRWNTQKELKPMHGGAIFKVSPWAMTWDDENYYLVAFDDWSKTCRHYRVDKMMHISLLNERRDGENEYKSLDMNSYSKSTFGMYSGKFVTVHIEFPNSFCGVFIDRFGLDVDMRPKGKDRSEVVVNVAVSPQFFGWVFSLGKDVRITSPKDVIEEMKNFGNDVMANYK